MGRYLCSAKRYSWHSFLPPAGYFPWPCGALPCLPPPKQAPVANISAKPGVIGLRITPFLTRFVASRADWWMSIPGIHFCSPAAREERT